MTMEEEQQEDPIFGTSESGGSANDSVTSFSFFGYSIRKTIKEAKPDLDPLEVVRKLLEDFEHTESIDKSHKVVHLHRIIENTHARRRLEKWSLRVIAAYLMIVCLIVIFTYAQVPSIGLPYLVIPDNIMVAILTTTTANIIGLGLIVLRGHFLAKEHHHTDED